MRIGLTILAAVSLTLTLTAADIPFTGTWKLDVAKSKVSSDLASQIMKIEQTGQNSYKTIIDGVSKSGEKRHQEINRVLDGKEHPVTGVGVTAGATEINQQVNSTTRKVTQKRDGKVVSEFTSTISPDGKIMTNHRITGNTEEVLVFDKQ